MKVTSYIILFWVVLAAVISAQEPVTIDTVQSAPGITIESAVDKSEVYIGDLITYRLTIIYNSDITLTPPPIGANLGMFDVKDYQTDEVVRLEDGRFKNENRFVLTTFTTGDYIIPPIPVEFMTADSVRKFLISEPMPILVKSLIAEGADTADIRDIKGPIDLKKRLPVWYYIIGAVIVLIILYLIWRWRRKRGQEGESELVDTRKPWEIAFEDLAHLSENRLPEKNEFKLFYIEITEIIRAFMGRMYQIPVLDMTTDEFCIRMIDEKVDSVIYDRVKAYLNFADLVKFARFVPETERMNVDFEEAREIIESVRQNEMAKVTVPYPAEEAVANPVISDKAEGDSNV